MNENIFNQSSDELDEQLIRKQYRIYSGNVDVCHKETLSTVISWLKSTFLLSTFFFSVVVVHFYCRK